MFNQEDIELTSILHKWKNSSNKVSAETLRGIAHELLASIGADARHSRFNNYPLKHMRSRRCELDLTVLSMRDEAIARRYDRITKDKREWEEHKDVVEVVIPKKKWKGRWKRLMVHKNRQRSKTKR